jgi:hypothetical protein
LPPSRYQLPVIQQWNLCKLRDTHYSAALRQTGLFLAECVAACHAELVAEEPSYKEPDWAPPCVLVHHSNAASSSSIARYSMLTANPTSRFQVFKRQAKKSVRILAIGYNSSHKLEAADTPFFVNDNAKSVKLDPRRPRQSFVPSPLKETPHLVLLGILRASEIPKISFVSQPLGRLTDCNKK